jgi:hypothetical protein
MPAAAALRSIRTQQAVVTPQPCAPAFRALRQRAMAQPIVEARAQARLMQLLLIAAAHRAAAADMLAAVHHTVVVGMAAVVAEGAKLYC